MKITYEKKIIAQRKGNRDFKNKLLVALRRPFPNTIHVFEDLDKEDMVSRKKVGRRKRNSRTPWRSIHRRISEVALTAFVDLRNTSRECPDAGS